MRNLKISLSAYIKPPYQTRRTIEVYGITLNNNDLTLIEKGNEELINQRLYNR